jgi:hypothetical protein
MSGVATAIVASSVITGYTGSQAAKKAAQTQADSARYAADLQQAQYEQAREDLAPYRELGYTSLEDINRLKPYLTSQFGDEQLAQYLDPSMAFRMKYGTQATERLGNVSGGALSGNTMRALQDFGQNLASSEYGNAFNRFQTERTNIYNTLANIAGMGQGAVNTGINAGQTSAANQGQLAVGAANAQAAGTVGAANAWNNALQTPSNYLQLASLTGKNPFGTSSGTTNYLTSSSPNYIGVTDGQGLRIAPNDLFNAKFNVN